MKKYLFLTLFLAATQANSGGFEVGELIENETKIQEFCSSIKNADDRCNVKNLEDFMMAAIIVNEKEDDIAEVAVVIVEKAEFAKNEGKKVKAKFTDFNPVGTIVEVM